MDDQNKNLILATALSFLVILVWFLVFPPEEPVSDPNAPAQLSEQATGGDVALTPPAAVTEAAPGAAPQAATASTSDAPRLPIETPAVEGSISLLGGRIDDLSLKGYNETLEPDSPIVRLLSPVDEPGAYYALYGWAPAGALSFDDVPGANTVWSVESGETLSVNSPVTLRWDSPSGLIFRRVIAIDEDFMFSITQSVENPTETSQRMQPYGIIARHGEPETVNFFVLHEGVVAMADGGLIESDYDDMLDYDFVEREGARAEVTQIEQNGWIGFTDKNWMTTLIPTPGQAFTSVAKYVGNADIYQTETRLATQSVAAGQTITVESRLFAGAKEWEAIRGYEKTLGIEGFIDSIDWGWFYFLTKPIFFVLHELNLLIGNMGVAIIVLTLLIKALLLPLAWKSYVSMARMKELQPQMEKLKEKAGDDRQKLQVAMMELYKKEKVNPAAGCLPILLQIPIFFSLYKVIFVTIELRHAPFFGPFQDLSAPDPTSLMNLFGLLPNAAPEPGSILALIFIGILPLLLGISMWLQQKLNPAPTDPTQAMIFAWLPWVFMFMLGTFASGLIVYWIANNVITFSQQYFIMRRHGYKPDVFGNITASFKKKKPTEDK
ncbi:membrane protein insertase YidC [Dinoroseobacter sp. S124A]|uniref:membrane protein insertase YidC n=1 Tax=Dinoroseobacter sp. S124A TaxID=3415128 RepID=UPI003C7C6AA6